MNKNRMPTVRDVSVRSVGLKSSPEMTVSGADIAASKSSPELVTVMGFGKSDVLFRSDKANCIQVRDGAGVISAMLVRLKPGIWGFSKRGDADWNEVLAIYANEDRG